ncbi:MAG: hypothetical protein LAT63_00170 [Marinobacter sp.]|nr:hypothetical protein [Marinobacter sp.]
MRPTPYPTVAQAREAGAERHLRRKLQEEFGSNSTDVYVLTENEFRNLWLAKRSSYGQSEGDLTNTYHEITGTALELVNGQTGNLISAYALGRLATDMHRSGSIRGTYRIVQKNGRNLIIFSGNPNLRLHLTSRVYGVAHPKVIKMGVGLSSANSSLKGGALITLIVSPTVRSLEWLLTEKHESFESVLAHVSTDIVKGLIAAVSGYLIGGLAPAAMAAAGFTIVTIIPVAIGLAVAIAVGLGLDAIDSRYGITQRLVDSLVQSRSDWIIQTSRTRREFNYYFGSLQGNLDFIHRLTGAGGWYGP